MRPIISQTATAAALALLLAVPVSLAHAVDVESTPTIEQEPLQASGLPKGEVTITIGYCSPQGEFASYSDPGPQFSIRGELEIPGAPFLSGWADFSYTLFEHDSFDTEIEVGDFSFPVTQTTKQDAVSAHIGLQLSSHSDNEFFRYIRPRAALGVGIYHFDTSVSLNTDSDIGDDIVLDSDTLDSHTCGGWRGILGADLYFDPRWGVCIEFVYDNVFGLHRRDGDLESDETARFQSFSIGAVISFGT
jgi:hypothetical protein